ncbi:MAG: ribosome maturation factor RimM [Anaerolineae bacterium]|nr:ribosome maturation factor RimM [Anaerolineae bacterium]MDW8098423.1 ribosome maturation factor RimM [Anaerolineae bacterium]
MVRARAQPHYLAIGRITAPFGIRGEVKVEIHTGWPERFVQLKRVYVGDAAARVVTATEVESARLHKGHAILKLGLSPDRNAAEALRGRWLFVSREEAMPLGEGEYYLHEIIGLEVWEGDRYLGRVVEILEAKAGANDVYVVRGQRGELLLPAIRQVILHVDLEAGRMEVAVPPGLEPT